MIKNIVYYSFFELDPIMQNLTSSCSLDKTSIYIKILCTWAEQYIEYS